MKLPLNNILNNITKQTFLKSVNGRTDARGSVTRSKRQFDNWPGSYSDQNRHEWQFCATYTTAAMKWGKWKAKVLLEDELYIALLHSLRASATSICLAVLHCVHDCCIALCIRLQYWGISAKWIL